MNKKLILDYLALNQIIINSKFTLQFGYEKYNLEGAFGQYLMVFTKEDGEEVSYVWLDEEDVKSVLFDFDAESAFIEFHGDVR